MRTVFGLTAIFVICALNYWIENLYLLIVSIVVVLVIAFSRYYIGEFLGKHRAAADLAIELIAVGVGVYLAIAASNYAQEKSDRERLLTMIESTKEDNFYCAGYLRAEFEDNDGYYGKSDSIFLRVRGSRLRHLTQRPTMYGYLITNQSALQYLHPKMFRWLVNTKWYLDAVYDHFDKSIQPSLEIYKRDLSNMMAIFQNEDAILEMQIDQMKGKITLDTLISRLDRAKKVPILLWSEDVDWYGDEMKKRNSKVKVYTTDTRWKLGGQ